MRINIIDFVDPDYTNLACFYIYGWFKKYRPDIEINYIAVEPFKEYVDGQVIPAADWNLVSIFVQQQYNQYKKLLFIEGGIVIGGPYVHYISEEHHNIIKGFAEPWLNETFANDIIEDDTKHLKIPINGKLNSTVYYPQAYGCYWGKCKFCDYKVVSPIKKKVEFTSEKQIRKDFDIIDGAGKNPVQIYLSGEAISKTQFHLIDNLCRRRNFKWGCFARGDKVWIRNLKTLDSMQNLNSVFFGVEIMSDAGLKLIDKGTTVKLLNQSILYTALCGIEVEIGLMTHMPWSLENSERIIDESIDNLLKLKDVVDKVYIARTTLYPGTPWHNEFANVNIEGHVITKAEKWWDTYTTALLEIFEGKIVYDPVKVGKSFDLTERM